MFGDPEYARLTRKHNLVEIVRFLEKKIKGATDSTYHFYRQNIDDFTQLYLSEVAKQRRPVIRDHCLTTNDMAKELLMWNRSLYGTPPKEVRHSEENSKRLRLSQLHGIANVNDDEYLMSSSIVLNCPSFTNPIPFPHENSKRFACEGYRANDATSFNNKMVEPNKDPISLLSRNYSVGDDPLSLDCQNNKTATTATTVSNSMNNHQDTQDSCLPDSVKSTLHPLSHSSINFIDFNQNTNLVNAQSPECSKFNSFPFSLTQYQYDSSLIDTASPSLLSPTSTRRNLASFEIPFVAKNPFRSLSSHDGSSSSFSIRHNDSSGIHHENGQVKSITDASLCEHCSGQGSYQQSNIFIQSVEKPIEKLHIFKDQFDMELRSKFSGKRVAAGRTVKRGTVETFVRRLLTYVKIPMIHRIISNKQPAIKPCAETQKKKLSSYALRHKGEKENVSAAPLRMNSSTVRNVLTTGKTYNSKIVHLNQDACQEHPRSTASFELREGSSTRENNVNANERTNGETDINTKRKSQSSPKNVTQQSDIKSYTKFYTQESPLNVPALDDEDYNLSRRSSDLSFITSIEYCENPDVICFFSAERILHGMKKWKPGELFSIYKQIHAKALENPRRCVAEVNTALKRIEKTNPELINLSPGSFVLQSALDSISQMMTNHHGLCHLTHQLLPSEPLRIYCSLDLDGEIKKIDIQAETTKRISRIKETVILFYSDELQIGFLIVVSPQGSCNIYCPTGEQRTITVACRRIPSGRTPALISDGNFSTFESAKKIKIELIGNLLAQEIKDGYFGTPFDRVTCHHHHLSQKLDTEEFGPALLHLYEGYLMNQLPLYCTIPLPNADLTCFMLFHSYVLPCLTR